MSYGAVFGAMAAAFDSWPMKGRSKLDSAGADAERRFYMLAAYCFDAARKLEYVYKATRRYALEVDPQLAAEIKQDNDALGLTSGDWKATAETAERILIRLLDETAEEHAAILNLVTGAKR